MKSTTVVFMLFASLFAEGKSIMATHFSYENTGINFAFYLNSWFGFGSSGSCPKVEFFVHNKSSETIYIEAY